MTMTGRRMLVTDCKSVTAQNITDIVEKAMMTHVDNAADIEYLWNYYRGEQPILRREKNVRPDICNRIVENRANEIVSFKTGYLCGEPIQYVGKSSGDAVSSGVAKLNAMMESIDKDACDRDLVEWMMIAGTAYRLILPRGVTDGCPPFELYVPDPRTTFVVYSADVGHVPMLGATYYTDDDGVVHMTAWSTAFRWELEDGKVVSETANPMGDVPIIEYPANNARLGSFETVLPLLDANNALVSNRMDGIEQFVQAFLKFVNTEIDRDKLEEFIELGAIMVKSPPGVVADVDLVTAELDQSQTQVTKDDIYSSILTICGMPNRNGGTSTSDTGQAVIFRDGWSAAESRAKDCENSYRRPERRMLSLVLRICRTVEGAPPEVAGLMLEDIALKFTRRNYEAIQSKSQVLVSMLENEKIHPKLAFEASGLFVDPERAYAQSMAYYEAERAKEEKIFGVGEPDAEGPSGKTEIADGQERPKS